MRVISWNVNSVRTRLERILGVLDRHRPDLLCLQETKVTDDAFPHEAVEAAGYRAEVHGQRTYNGVALISREPVADLARGFPGDPAPDQARVISGALGGIRFVNLYVINGKAVGSDKYALKLAWLDALESWLRQEHDPGEPLVLLGDFNVAPEDRDVHDPEAWRERVLCSTPERERVRRLCAWGLEDLYRRHVEEPGRFTWWDYRGGAFPRDHGLRIDLALGTRSAAGRCAGAEIDRQERKKGDWEAKPSDHAPLLVDFNA